MESPLWEHFNATLTLRPDYYLSLLGRSVNLLCRTHNEIKDGNWWRTWEWQKLKQSWCWQQTNKQTPVLSVESQTWRWTERRERDWVHRLLVIGFIREGVSQGGGCWRDMQQKQWKEIKKRWHWYSCNTTHCCSRSTLRDSWGRNVNTHTVSMNNDGVLYESAEYLSPDLFSTLRWNVLFIRQPLFNSNEMN